MHRRHKWARWPPEHPTKRSSPRRSARVRCFSRLCGGCSWHHPGVQAPRHVSANRRHCGRQNGLTDSYLYATLQLLWLRQSETREPQQVEFSALGRLAQLVRAPSSHGGGRWFESISAHQETSREVKQLQASRLVPFLPRPVPVSYVCSPRAFGRTDPTENGSGRAPTF